MCCVPFGRINIIHAHAHKSLLQGVSGDTSSLSPKRPRGYPRRISDSEEEEQQQLSCRQVSAPAVLHARMETGCARAVGPSRAPTNQSHQSTRAWCAIRDHARMHALGRHLDQRSRSASEAAACMLTARSVVPPSPLPRRLVRLRYLALRLVWRQPHRTGSRVLFLGVHVYLSDHPSRLNRASCILALCVPSSVGPS